MVARLSEAGYQAPVPGGSSPESECEGGGVSRNALSPWITPRAGVTTAEAGGRERNRPSP